MVGREEFRLDRVKGMQDVSDALLPQVEAAFRSDDPAEALRDALEKVFRDEFGSADIQFGLFDAPGKAWDWFWGRVKPALDKVKESSDPKVVADWLGTAVLNGARVAAADESSKVWLSRRDGRVRPAHVDADGQSKSWSDPFVVCGGVEMMFPGDPVGDPSCWLNCRCVAAPASLVSSVSEVVAMADVQEVQDPEVDPVDEEWDDGYDDDEDIIPFGVPWHGVLAVEGSQTGDNRMFEPGSLSWEEPPLHLRWQERDIPGHDGAVVVASIDEIWRDGDRIMGQGMFSDSAMADAAVGALMDGDTGGTSIDADSGELSDDAPDNLMQFSLGRIRGATMVHIPALVEAAIRLGPAPDRSPDLVAAAVSEAPWDGSASRFTPEQWRKSCIVHIEDSMSKAAHKLPILEPDGTLSRAGVHAAAARLGQTDAPPAELSAAKGRLRAAYRKLGEDVPDSLTASVVEFGRGPGWVTNPKETRQLHHYWTKGAGAKKIRWGTPGDFRRLRRHLAKYINPLYLNRTVAQWHHDALGYWPGQCGKPGNPPCGKHRTASLAVESDHEDALHPGARVHTGEHAAATEWGQAVQSLSPGAEPPLGGAAQGGRCACGRAPQLAEDALPERARVPAGQEQVRTAGVQDVQAGSLRQEGAQDPVRAAMAEGGQERRAGRLLVVDRGEDDAATFVAGGSQVRNHQRRAERVGQDVQGSPGGVGIRERADTGRADDRSSVPGETVLQSGASGTCHVCGEHTQAMGAPAGDGLTAAALREFPYEWFSDPGFDGPTPLTVEADGRVFGHLATWGVCHIGISGRCTAAPESRTDYALFRTGAVLTDRGRVSVGHLTAYTGHAHLEDESERPVDFRAAAAHYDNTGTVVADVAAGEDEYGIWVAGAVRDELTDQQLHALQAGALSGDWRGYNGNLELVAALVVNVPGFPVQRPALAAGGAVAISPVLSNADRVAAVRATVNAERIAALASLGL